MNRRFAVACTVAMSLFSAASAHGQLGNTRHPNPALWQSTPDAAALGQAGRGFFELGLTDDDKTWLGSVGVGVAGGMLRGTYGRSSYTSNYALGYARRITEHSVGRFGSWGAGIDITYAYQPGSEFTTEARAGRITVPLSLRFGSPSTLSLSPYVGPYAELGSASFFTRNCDATRPGCTLADRLTLGTTYSTGLSIGAEITAWRLRFVFGAAGVPDRLIHYGAWNASGGLSLRF